MSQHVNILSRNDSVMLSFVNELRDVNIQSDPLRFRRNIERIGEIMAYEISKELQFAAVDVKTPLGVKKSKELTDSVVLGAILRASLPFHNGMLNYFDRSENAFLAAFRESDGQGGVRTNLSYAATPDLSGKVLILSDPMLATGQSMVDCYRLLLEYGSPKEVHFVSIVGSQQGMDHVLDNVEDCSVWLADLDPELNERYYIIPGLGDAGDLAYGGKLDSE